MALRFFETTGEKGTVAVKEGNSYKAKCYWLSLPERHPLLAPCLRQGLLTGGTHGPCFF